jgi:hypothetical protein
MAIYPLEHLTQPQNQNVSGPIQDDEALFMYSIIIGKRISRILEIGGLNAYSANNFLQAMHLVKGTLYTVDINPVKKLADNHKVIQKNVLHLTTEDVDNLPLEFVFFDCHDMVQMDMYHLLVQKGIINDNTILALHDTNLQYPPHGTYGWPVKNEPGLAHQPVERTMVNLFKEIGNDIFLLHTTPDKHHENFLYRHGITICQKFKPLAEVI